MRIITTRRNSKLKGRQDEQQGVMTLVSEQDEGEASIDTDAGPYDGSPQNVTLAAPSQSSTLPEWSPNDASPVPISPPLPDPTDTAWTWTSSSTELTDVPWVTSPPPIITTPEESNGNTEDLQSTLSGNPYINTPPDPISSNSPSLSTELDDLGIAGNPSLQLQLLSALSNIVATSNSEATEISILQALMSSLSFAHPSQAPFALPSTTSTRTAAPDSSTSALVSSSAPTSIASEASALPRMEHKDGAMSSNTVRTIVGATIGGLALLILILFAILAYIRRSTLRNLYSNMHIRFPSLRPKPKYASSTPAIQSEENFFRREPIQVHPRDLETATVSSGSHYSYYSDSNSNSDSDFDEGEGYGMNEKWQEIDVRDARSGKMQQDRGEWLESWRRGKERMVTTRQSPELHSNPDLPLPPINWGATRDGEGDGDGEKRKY